jgi:hypothetical protein
MRNTLLGSTNLPYLAQWLPLFGEHYVCSFGRGP